MKLPPLLLPDLFFNSPLRHFFDKHSKSPYLVDHTQESLNLAHNFAEQALIEFPFHIPHKEQFSVGTGHWLTFWYVIVQLLKIFGRHFGSWPFILLSGVVFRKLLMIMIKAGVP